MCPAVVQTESACYSSSSGVEIEALVWGRPTFSIFTSADLDELLDV